MFVAVRFHCAPVPAPPDDVPLTLVNVGSTNVPLYTLPANVTSHMPPAPLPCKYVAAGELKVPVPAKAAPVTSNANTSPPVSTLVTLKDASLEGLSPPNASPKTCN